MLFIEYMLSRGINAYRGATQLRYVAPPEGRAHAENSKWLMDHIVYMPIHSGMTEKEIRLTVSRAIDCYFKLVDFLQLPNVPKPANPRDYDLIERARL